MANFTRKDHAFTRVSRPSVRNAAFSSFRFHCLRYRYEARLIVYEVIPRDETGSFRDLQGAVGSMRHPETIRVRRHGRPPTYDFQFSPGSRAGNMETAGGRWKRHGNPFTGRSRRLHAVPFPAHLTTQRRAAAAAAVLPCCWHRLPNGMSVPRRGRYIYRRKSRLAKSSKVSCVRGRAWQSRCTVKPGSAAG